MNKPHSQLPYQVIRSIAHLRRWIDQSPHSSIGFVPTMGCLHQGHLNLISHSLSATQRTLVSIFINPTQFGPNEDLECYPSTLQADLSALAKLSVSPNSIPIPNSFDGSSQPLSLNLDPPSENLQRTVSAVFLPTSDIIYPTGLESGTVIDVRALDQILEGAKRPGFFRGVATVVLKLFHLVEPSLAFFGQKDLHQALLLRRMHLDLHLRRPHHLIIIPTAREPESVLAQSSRNTYLSPQQRLAASCLFDGLSSAAQLIRTATHDITLLQAHTLVQQAINRAASLDPSISLDFFSINHPVSFQSLDSVKPGDPVALSGAILVGDRPVRLLDNLVLNCDLNQGIQYHPNLST